VDVVPGPGPADPEAEVRVAALAGPRADWLDDASQAGFWQVSWEITPDEDRVGVRLTGPVLRRAAAFREAELPSEGLVRGAVQVPPSGLPVIFLADHPVTGGYPVVAVVLDADVDRVAQVRPGQRLRFAPAGWPSRSGAAGRRPGRPIRPDSTCSWWGW
jgi:allophanate hydrolase subunit 2